jgi:hypothetical protein
VDTEETEDNLFVQFPSVSPASSVVERFVEDVKKSRERKGR